MAAATSVLEVPTPHELTCDSRVVAIRWDLVEWGLVLDLDVPLSEGKGVPVRRGWVCFSDVADITWPMRGARLPNGCWLEGPIVASPARRGTDYVFRALLPSFGEDDTMNRAPVETVVIRAHGLFGVMSAATAQPPEGGLRHSERIALAKDEELLSALVAALR